MRLINDVAIQWSGSDDRVGPRLVFHPASGQPRVARTSSGGWPMSKVRLAKSESRSHTFCPRREACITLTNESIARPCMHGMAVAGGEEACEWLELDSGAPAQPRGSVSALAAPAIPWSAAIPFWSPILWEALWALLLCGAVHIVP